MAAVLLALVLPAPAQDEVKVEILSPAPGAVVTGGVVRIECEAWLRLPRRSPCTVLGLSVPRATEAGATAGLRQCVPAPVPECVASVSVPYRSH